MFTEQQVKEQRVDALNMLLQVQTAVDQGPHYLFIDPFREALKDQISVLEHPPTAATSFRQVWGNTPHGATLHRQDS